MLFHGLRLDRFDVGIGQPEVVADFMDQDMGDDMVKRFIVLGPVVDDGTAIEPDHIGQPGNVIVALERQTRALEQPQQVEFAVGG